MDILRFLSENYRPMVEEWADAVFHTYKEEGAKFFASNPNQFANPVGHTFRTCLETIFLELAKGGDTVACTKPLDEILHIRAVQGFSPSVALCFLPTLKEIVFREVTQKFPDGNATALLHDWNIAADRLLLLGFDIYMGCRETLWRQKANHLYNRTHKLLEKSNLLVQEVEE